jgi:hypothetical protein
MACCTRASASSSCRRWAIESNSIGPVFAVHCTDSLQDAKEGARTENAFKAAWCECRLACEQEDDLGTRDEEVCTCFQVYDWDLQMLEHQENDKVAECVWIL